MKSFFERVKDVVTSRIFIMSTGVFILFAAISVKQA